MSKVTLLWNLHGRRLRRNSGDCEQRKRRLTCERLEDRRVLSAGPYAPAAEVGGSTAIHQHDPAIVAWAAGWRDYVPGQDVDVDWQTPERALGAATGDSLDIVSLGRGGQITLTFDHPIRDGSGADFVVFENGFADGFVELGYVEVSSNGEDFFRFPNDSATASPVGPGGALDPTNLYGLASKYRVGWGTPFDLEDLVGVSPLLDVESITAVKIVDIPGDGTALDSDGDPIFDPFPTTGSAGLDLEAVGVLNSNTAPIESTLGLEVLGASLPAEGHWNGPAANGVQRPGLDGGPVVVGEFESEGVFFNNVFSPSFGSWTGWSYSNTTDTTTPGFTNQYSAIAGQGAGSSNTYAVAFRDTREGVVWEDTYPLPTISMAPNLSGTTFQSVSITNTTYAALAMRNGDPFAKKFGGVAGDDPDWFLLTIEGKDDEGLSTGTLEFYLADYRFADNSQDYIVEDWAVVDLSSLQDATSLEFKVTSSDVGTFGINTPAFFALDNLVLAEENRHLAVSVDRGTLAEAAAPVTSRFEDLGFSLDEESFWNGSDGAGGFVSDRLEFNNDYNATFAAWQGWAYSNRTDTTIPGFANQYSALAGGGALNSTTYGVSFAGGVVPTVSLSDVNSGLEFQSLMVTNTTYAGLSMLLGDPFAKKFGGTDGSEPDWFRLTVEGFNLGDQSVGAVEFYLADYRFADSADDYIVDDWRVVDLSGLDGAVRLSFSLDSSDVGMFGMNTPAFFAVDNIVLSDTPSSMATVTRSTTDLTHPLSVRLMSDDLTELSVPATVEIPANERTVQFPIYVVDDMVRDGVQTATITATADGYVDGAKFVVVTDDDDPLLVSSFEPTSSGFVVEFGSDLEPEALQLFGSEPVPDAVLVGQATGPVAGSLWVTPSARGVTFLKTGGPLLPDTYTVTLRSAASGFKSPAGIPLDGDGNGQPGGHFENTFTVSAPEAGNVTVSIPDFVRGPGQVVNIPANQTNGLPVSVSNGAGIRNVAFQISFDPDLLEVTGVTVADGMPVGATAALNVAAAGRVEVTFSSPLELPASSTTLVMLQASVPAADATEIYRSSGLLDIHDVSIRDAADNSLPTTADDGWHAVTFFGDVSGNGRINAADASLVARLVANLETGLPVSLVTDPVLVGDVSGNSRVNAFDASLVAQVAALISVPTIPPIPDGVVIATDVLAGLSPRVAVGREPPAGASDVTVPSAGNRRPDRSDSDAAPQRDRLSFAGRPDYFAPATAGSGASQPELSGEEERLAWLADQALADLLGVWMTEKLGQKDGVASDLLE